MTLQGAVDALGRLAAGNDPIIYRGEDTTPRAFANERAGRVQGASDFRIAYITLRDGKARLLKNGTFSGMLLDRQRDDLAIRRMGRCHACGRRGR